VNVKLLPKRNTLNSLNTMSNEQGSLHYCLDATQSKQEFQHLREHVWVKKLVIEGKFYFGT